MQVALTKKPKKEKEPEFLISPTNQPMLNYKVVYMRWWQTVVYFIAAFVAGAAVGFVFYGGIGTDGFGNPTTITYICNTVVMLICGLLAGFLFLPVRSKQILNKRSRDLQIQFRELMDSLAASLGTGKNTMDSFLAAKEDLAVQFDKKSHITKELDNIIAGLHNNINVETLLMDFGKRSGLSDIQDFASVFEICYRKGGNLKDVVRRTYDVLSDKMQIKQEIETKVLSNKTEANVMSVIPIGIVAMIKMSSPDFATSFVSPAGLLATTISVGIFVGSFFLARKVLDIEV